MADDDGWQDYTPPSGGGEGWQDYSAPVTVGGLGRAIEEGTQRGVAGTAALPRLLTNAVQGALAPAMEKARNWYLSTHPEFKDQDFGTGGKPLVDLPDYQRAREEIRRNWGGMPEYEPQNLPERALANVAEQLSNVVGPAGRAAGLARVVFPGAGVTVAHEAGLGPLGEAAGAFIGGLGAGRVGEASKLAGIPSASKVREAAQIRGYRPVEQAMLDEKLAPGYTLPSSVTQRQGGGLQYTPPQVIPGQAKATYDTIVNALDQRGIRPARGGKIYEALAPLENAKDMKDYMDARVLLGRVSGEARPGALLARDMVDTAMEKRVPGSIALLQEADANWNAMRTAERFEDIRTNREARAAATHSGGNAGNLMRQMATSMLAKGSKYEKYLTDSDRQALTDLAHGTLTQNLTRWTANVLGGGQGIGFMLAGALGGAGGEQLGESHLGWAAPFVGLALKRRYNAMVSNQARRVTQQMLARSPEAARRGVIAPGPPRSALPYGVLPTYLSQQGNSEK